ncbi:MAG: hypothetical protein PGN24_00395 [Microbacterium arborescens]
MRWERFFEDLEHQLDSEWEAERAALDTEAERLRLARLGLRERIAALARLEGSVSLHLAGGRTLRGMPTGSGPDWIMLESPAGRLASLIPTEAIVAIGAGEGDVLASARASASTSPLSERMTFGFVLRDLVRRRSPVRIHAADDRDWAGTIDRAGADHLDLAVHDLGEARRAAAVTAHRIIPFRAIASVEVGGLGV